MSDASRVSVYTGIESTFGTIATTVNGIPFTSESLKQNTESERSAEIRADRNVADIVRTAISSGGDINTEWRFRGLEDLMRSFFMDGAPRALVVLDCSAKHSWIISPGSI